MKRSVFMLASMVAATSLLSSCFGQSIGPVAYVTIENRLDDRFNGIFGVLLHSDGFPPRIGDIMRMHEPDFPHGIHHFPDYSYVITANFRFDQVNTDGFSKDEPQTAGQPSWETYNLNPEGTKSPGGLAITEIDVEGESVIRIYISESDNDWMGVYNIKGEAVSPNPIPVQLKPLGMHIVTDPSDPSTQYLFVANNLSNSITKVTLPSYSLDHLESAGESPVDVRAVTIDGQGRLYVVNSPDLVPGGLVTVMDWDGNYITEIDVGTKPMGIDNAPWDSPFSDRLYVANYGTGTVSCIDMIENKVFDTIVLGSVLNKPPNPTDVAISPVSYNNEYRGIIIDTANRSVHVFILNETEPFHEKAFEETNEQIMRARDLNAVTIIEQNVY